MLRELTEDHMTVLSDSALAALRKHDWPGNVRELRHVIACAFVFADGGHIDGRDIVQAIERGTGSSSPAPSTREVRSLLEALELAGYRVDMAAAILGVHRATVYRRMRRLGIGPNDRHACRGVLSGA